MARPIKNYCDYFTHDRDMRNHRKVKALRNKFSITGYAIWVMILEYLTGVDGNEFENSDTELEIISGDFGVPFDDIRNVINYCLKLEMIFEKNGFIHSESLDERLSVVYEKRKVSKELSKKQCRSKGKYNNNNTVDGVVSVETMPQSKVKYSKVEKSKEEKLSIKVLSAVAEKSFDFEKILNPTSFPNWRAECSAFLKDDYFKQQFCKSENLPMGNTEKLMSDFVVDQNLKNDFKNVAGLKKHFINSYKKNKTHPQGTSKAFIDVPEDYDYDQMEVW
jgi:hypothetical protein